MNKWIILPIAILLAFFIISYIYFWANRKDPNETHEYCSVCNKDTFHHRGKCNWCGTGKHWDYNR